MFESPFPGSLISNFPGGGGDLFGRVKVDAVAVLRPHVTALRSAFGVSWRSPKFSPSERHIVQTVSRERRSSDGRSYCIGPTSLPCALRLGFRIWGLGFGVWGLGFGVWCLGSGV